MCLLMGGEGLTQATKVAILNANYIAARLRTATRSSTPRKRAVWRMNASSTPVRWTPRRNVTVDDIAKRLVDSGFHAPTMSWPVAGTLMVEPTESEPKDELDRFCDAMLSIRSEAQDIIDGKIDADNNPLKHAPHTVRDLVGEWDRPYSREQACFPPGNLGVDKYWPAVNRVDNAYGDRHLICTCPPMSDYEENEA